MGASLVCACSACTVVMPPQVGEGSLALPAWMERVHKDVNYDTKSTRKEYMFKMPAAMHAAMAPALMDKRDSIMLDLMFNITVVAIPSLIFQFLLPASLQPYSAYFGVLHIAMTYGLFVQRFILCLHYSEHRRLFRAGSVFTLLHGYCPYILCPVFGIPCGVYRLHHVIMHHLEDNICPMDLSSTMPYQRDSVLHFLMYWARHTFAVHLELPYYAIKTQRYDVAVQAAFSDVFWFAMVYYLYCINPTATTYTFILPYFISSFAMMFGNWSQHIFVDPARPTVDYALTYNCINHIENLYTFNDGYHIVHHINSRIHWAEMPQRFLKELPKYAEEGAITFSGLHFFQVGLYVFTGQWSALAKAYVHLTDSPMSDEEVIKMLKSRLVPCTVPESNDKKAT